LSVTEAGLLDALEAELSYAFLGGGIGPKATDAGAIAFSASFAATDAFTYAQNFDQIKNANASRNQDVGLIAGYGLTSAITAGFNSNFQQGQIDDWIGVDNKSLFGGAFSQGIGGAISGARNNILQNGGGLTASTAFSAVSGFASSYAGQVVHNGTDDLAARIVGKANSSAFSSNYSFPDFAKNFFANIASGVTQQYAGNLANQFGIKNGFNSLGPSPAWWTFFGRGQDWWGAYINGLGGFQSDMAQDAGKLPQ
jgi:hypothetical protein